MSGEVKLNMDIRAYVHAADAGANGASKAWISQSEIPTGAEIANSINEDIELTPNRIIGPWKSKEKYLKAHYELLREDAVSPLRDAIEAFRKNPEMMDDDQAVSVYEKVGFESPSVLARLTVAQVHITGFTFAPLGIAARIKFSTIRAGKAIPWRYTKRLTSGSIVALTPVKDKFVTKCIVAIVAARPLAGVEATPPGIDIYFTTPEEIEIDPQQEWTMVEAKQGYYEASRHTMKGLQKLSHEKYGRREYLAVF